jgi:hypothetical protein
MDIAHVEIVRISEERATFFFTDALKFITRSFYNKIIFYKILPRIKCD